MTESDKKNHPQRSGHAWFHLGVKPFFSIVIGCICLGLLSACAHEPVKNPQANLFDDTLQIYRGPLNHLDSVRRGACPMHPSCSEYGRQAVRKHGFLVGWAMAMDRLMRCGRDELKHIQRIWVSGEWKFYDPVSANDGWWVSGQNQESDPDSMLPGSN